jgi:hypothetical protein
MTQQTSPWIESKYGWNFGENGWNTGADENWLKFSFMFDRNVDGVVNTLPPATSGQAYFLTTDKRLYFSVGSVWYSTPTPKNFNFFEKSTGNEYQFNGTIASQVENSAQVEARLDSVEVTISNLGTAAFEDVAFFATKAQLDVSEASAAAYTDEKVTDLSTELASPTGAEGVGFSLGTVQERLGSFIVVTDGVFGAVADGVTDNTAAVIAAAVSVGVRGAVVVPANVKYNFNTVMSSASVPIECVFYDMSGINGGYLKDKMVGIYEKGDPTSESDTTVVVSSGHNAGIALDNTGKAGSASALARVGVLAWTAGRMDSGIIRSGARLEFAKSSVDATRWSMVLRKRAPMEAITANYNRWTTGKVVAIGDFVLNSNKFYKATTAGTTGATAPTHTVGIVSDGGVSWEYFQFSYDASPWYIDDLGRIATNTAPQAGQFQRWRQSPDDTNAMIIQYEPLGVSKNITFRGRPTDASSVAVTTVPDFRFTAAGCEFLNVALGSSVGRFTNDGFVHAGLIQQSSTAADGDTTPTVLNRASLNLTNTAATSITTLDDGVTDQVVTLITSNANTTLVNGAGLRLAGGVNFVMTQFSAITLKKTALTAAWIEISRSAK